MTSTYLEEKLKSNSIESLLYIATMEPKTQTEAIELIYGKKNINSNPVKKAREKLILEGALILGEGISKVPLKAQIDPFLEYLLKISQMRKTSKPNEHRLDETDIKYLKLVLDSDFFRSIFFNQYFIDNAFGVHRGAMSHENGKLSINGGAFGYIELALTSILFHSRILYTDFNDLYIKDIKEIVNNYTDSNRFVNNFLSNIDAEFYDEMIDHDIISVAIERSAIDYNPSLYFTHKYTEDDSFQYFIDKTVFNGLYLLFPIELIKKILLLGLASSTSTYFILAIVEARDRR
nr:hypothetical protein [uncultured Methanolobus sp.]